MNLKPSKIVLKPNSYLSSVFRRGSVNPANLTVPNINLTKAMTNLLAVWKMTEKGCINLYFHSYTFYMSYKLFSYLGSLSCFCPVNSSTPLLLISTRHKAIKNVRNNLYLHPKFFKITLKPNLYLRSVSRRGPVNQSNPSFPNINLTQAIANLLFAWESNQKWLQ